MINASFTVRDALPSCMDRFFNKRFRSSTIASSTEWKMVEHTVCVQISNSKFINKCLKKYNNLVKQLLTRSSLSRLKHRPPAQSISERG